MKKILFVAILTFTLNIYAQEAVFQAGEFFKFKIHYGFFNAGYATLDLKKSTFKNKNLFHATGKGWTTGISSWFMDVDDLYESYFDTQAKPYKFIRKVDEGGYTMNRELHFNHQKHQVLVNDYKKNSQKYFNTGKKIFDMLSAFYYLRNIDTSKLKKGDEIKVNMFLDNEIYPFRLKFLGKDITKTKLGKIHSLKFRPFVQSGRIFKEDESLTVWISDDQNKMPLLIKAKLMVGSLKASLMEYRGLKYDVNFKG